MQLLKHLQNVFFKLFLEGSKIEYIRKIRINLGFRNLQEKLEKVWSALVLWSL